MNIKYYISKSGSIIVLDENNNEREIEKTGKYKENLIQENIIETIENRIKELEDIVAKHPIETVNQKKFIPTATIVAIIFSLIIQFISYLLYIETSILVTNLFIALKKSFSFMFPLMMTVSLLGVIIDIARSSDYNEYIQKINADNLELETLKRILPKEREKLSKLNQDKSKYRLPAKYSFNQLYPVNDQYQLNNLSKYIKTYRRLGRSFDILYESYKNNTLKEFLYEYGFKLSEEEYKILVNYIKEKEIIIVSKKKKIKKQI